MIDLSTFKINNINIEENLMLISSVDEDYMLTTYNFLSEMSNEYIYHKKILYKKITEATSYNSINESFNDFFEIVKKMFKKFIEFLQKIYNKFISFFKSKSKKVTKIDIKNIKDKLSNFKESDSFKMNTCTYSIKDESIPNINIQSLLDKRCISINDLKNPDNIEYIKRIKNVLNSSEFFDMFRAQVINSNKKISENNYNTELIKVFRKGKESREEVNIDKEAILLAISFKETNNNMIDSVKKLKENMISEYKKIIENIENEISSISKMNFSDQDSTSIQLYEKARIDQLNSMMKIHSLAFSAKISAIKNCIEDTDNIINKTNIILSKEVK